jgi:hypothetical protein
LIQFSAKFLVVISNDSLPPLYYNILNVGLNYYSEAPSSLIREASLRLPLKANNENDPFKRSTSMRAYSNNTKQKEVIPQVKNWSDQLEAIKESF